MWPENKFRWFGSSFGNSDSDIISTASPRVAPLSASQPHPSLILVQRNSSPCLNQHTKSTKNTSRTNDFAKLRPKKLFQRKTRNLFSPWIVISDPRNHPFDSTFCREKNLSLL